MKSNRSKLIVLLAMAMLGSTGCASALVGDWRIAEAPIEADQYIRQIRFRDDGSYTGVVNIRGKEPVLLDGSYKFSGTSLHLKRLGKQDHTYGATYIVGGTLKITDGAASYSLKKQ